MAAKRLKIHKNKTIFRWSLFSLCLCVSVVNLSCSSKPTDLRTLVPAETLVYLETNDLAAALQPIVDAKPFMEVAKSKPDFSALKGVQLAIAVTGFETSEEKLTDEHSVGRVQPHFVAVAETHAWNYQANAFAEQKLGGFVREIYDSEPTLEKSDKNGGKYFKWTATDGRKAFALVDGSVIYFGNDETAIDKCLAVKRGESDSIAKTGKVPSASLETLARGYVSTDGIAQIANIIGLKYASEIGEDSEVQSAIAGILPKLLRNSVTEISWTSKKTEQGIEDKYSVAFKPDIGKVFNETLSTSGSNQKNGLEEFIPKRSSSVTRYTLKNPPIAWRSVLLTAQSQLNTVGSFVVGLSGSLFEPYGIANSELFLGSVAENRIVTARLYQEREEAVVVAKVKDLAQFKASVSKDLSLEKPPEIIDSISVWRSEDGSIAVAVVNDVVILGDSKAIDECLKAHTSGETFAKDERFLQFEKENATAVTVENQLGPNAELLNALSEPRDDVSPSLQRSITTTNFTQSGMERRTTSDFGLIGLIIAQLGGDE